MNSVGWLALGTRQLKWQKEDTLQSTAKEVPRTVTVTVGILSWWSPSKGVTGFSGHSLNLTLEAQNSKCSGGTLWRAWHPHDGVHRYCEWLVHLSGWDAQALWTHTWQWITQGTKKGWQCEYASQCQHSFPLLIIVRDLRCQSGFNSGPLLYPQTLTRAPWPHQPHTSGISAVSCRNSKKPWNHISKNKAFRIDNNKWFPRGIKINVGIKETWTKKLICLPKRNTIIHQY